MIDIQILVACLFDLVWFSKYLGIGAIFSYMYCKHFYWWWTLCVFCDYTGFYLGLIFIPYILCFQWFSCVSFIHFLYTVYNINKLYCTVSISMIKSLFLYISSQFCLNCFHYLSSGYHCHICFCWVRSSVSTWRQLHEGAVILDHDLGLPLGFNARTTFTSMSWICYYKIHFSYENYGALTAYEDRNVRMTLYLMYTSLFSFTDKVSNLNCQWHVNPFCLE